MTPISHASTLLIFPGLLLCVRPWVVSWGVHALLEFTVYQGSQTWNPVRTSGSQASWKLRVMYGIHQSPIGLDGSPWGLHPPRAHGCSPRTCGSFSASFSWAQRKGFSKNTLVESWIAERQPCCTLGDSTDFCATQECISVFLQVGAGPLEFCKGSRWVDVEGEFSICSAIVTQSGMLPCFSMGPTKSHYSSQVTGIQAGSLGTFLWPSPRLRK